MRGERIRKLWPTWRRDVPALIATLLLVWLGLVRGGKVPLLGLVDLGFHELGHLLTYVFPDLVTAVAGSVTQVAVPVGLAVYFVVVRNERASAAVCLAWAATAAADAAVYIADAPYERLELIGGEHDWAFALSAEGFDAMENAAGLAQAVRGLGWLFATAAVGLCLWPLGRRWVAPIEAPMSVKAQFRVVRGGLVGGRTGISHSVEGKLLLGRRSLPAARCAAASDRQIVLETTGWCQPIWSQVVAAGRAAI
ncbi:MAG TPA: hypothetical protein VM345_18880 [Acidimicrobiales bacterium]|jgi:hypothetical protein|nr:hypothetical protein [Acidimicrobiales bacterium]